MNQLFQYVYEVYKERSFTVAARNLYVSQPALSSAIKKLENELGLKLFDRSTAPLRATEAGEAYVRAIEEIRNIERNLANELNDMSQLRTGTVTVSGANFISSFVIPQIVASFSRRYPGIRVELVESNSPSLQDQLLREGTDLMLDYQFDPSLFCSMPLVQEHVLLCVPADCPVNEGLRDVCLSVAEIRDGRYLKENCPCAPLSAFAQTDFIILKPGNDMRDRGMRMCEDAGFTPKVVMQLDQLMTSFNMAHSGLGAAFVTDTLLHNVEGGEGLCCYRLENPLSVRTLYIAYKQQRYITGAVQAFIDAAQEVYS